MQKSFAVICLYLTAFLGVLMLCFFVLAFFRGRKIFRRDIVVCKIAVPRNLEVGPIVFEQILAAIHGAKLDVCDSISFEIAKIDNSIVFFFICPRKIFGFVKEQIYTQYSYAEITEVKDYAARKPNSNSPSVASTRVLLSEADIYPIKRYSQFEDKLNKTAVDPMACIMGTLVSLGSPSDEVWIQVALRPLDEKLRIRLVKCVKILGGGLFMGIENLQRLYVMAFITRKVWSRIVFFPLYLWFFIRGFFANAGDDFGLYEKTTLKSHEKENEIDACIDKVVKLLFDVNINVVYSSNCRNKEVLSTKIQEVVGSFKQFNQPHLNGFKADRICYDFCKLADFRRRVVKGGFILNNEELATIFHLPNATVKVPGLSYVGNRKFEHPSNLPVCEPFIGVTNFRGSGVRFGIKDVDRRRHIYIIGKTGMGKSTLLENMIYSDICSWNGVGVVDPHGDLADKVLSFVPPKRTNDVVLIDPSDLDFPIAFNMLNSVDPSYNSIICSGIVGVFKKIYAESWGPRLEHILRNSVMALLEYGNSSMLGIVKILQDSSFRKKVVDKISDPIVKSFWINEFEKMSDKLRIEAISPILNKVGQFLSDSVVRNMVGQTKNTFDLRYAMDKGKIVIVNLSKGRIGEDNSKLLGSMIVTKFQLEAMGRANVPERERKDFYLYVDEFQNFATDSFSTILSEARKYRLNLTIANQYIAQMPESVRDAVFGNVGSLISMQVGFDDADYISKQFGEEELTADLVGMDKYTAYARMLVDNMPTRVFSFNTLRPVNVVGNCGRDVMIRKASRERYCKPRRTIEEKIKKWSKNN